MNLLRFEGFSADFCILRFAIEGENNELANGVEGVWRHPNSEEALSR